MFDEICIEKVEIRQVLWLVEPHTPRKYWGTVTSETLP